MLWYEKSKGHPGFDSLLQRLADRANPIRRLAGRLEDAQVLWLDPNPVNNELALGLLGERAFCLATDLDQAKRQLRATQDWDLILTCWGHEPAGPALAQQLLDWMHSEGIRVPVVVFCDTQHAEPNRSTALRWGAAELCCQWPQLFRAVDRVLPGYAP